MAAHEVDGGTLQNGDNVTEYLPQHASILIFGDLILDEYLTGDVSRLAPDLPTPVFRSGSSTKYLGGAANVAQNLTSLGHNIQVHLLGVCGDDDAGAALMELLSRKRILAEDVQVLEARPTAHKLRVVAQNNQHLVRIDKETTQSITEGVQDILLEAVKRRLPFLQGIICSDYNKGCVTSALLQAIIHEAGIHGVPVIVDPKGSDISRYRTASVMTPNLDELFALTSMPVSTEDEVDQAAMTLLHQAQVQAIVLTRGERGVNIYDARGVCEKLAAREEGNYPRQVSGAGDTFVAAFTLAYCNAATALQSAKIANIAAGLVIRKAGTATVSRKELLEAMNPSSSPSFTISEAKILTLDTLVPKLDRARASGNQVIFTNGCFDLLHAGHVEILERAKLLGGVLVVGVNSDASVTSLKGQSRPVIPQHQRLRMLASLGCVDFVTMFSDPTPLGLIRAIQPNILVKGTDYAKGDVVGSADVENTGGKVELLPLVHGISTTKIVRNILEFSGVHENGVVE